MFKFAGEATWADSHAELIEFLAGATWSGFAVSLTKFIDKNGHLTPGQEKAAVSMMIKCKARDARKAPVGIKLAEVKGSPLMDSFSKASDKGRRYVQLTLGNVTISPADKNSKNPGFLYVKEGGEYRGKIDPEGMFFPAGQNIPDKVLKIVRDMITDPAKAAGVYGQKTGNCCCCDAKLTNALSIRLGIGPICRSKWGW